MKKFLFIAVLLSAASTVVVVAPKKDLSKVAPAVHFDAPHYTAAIVDNTLAAGCVDHNVVVIPSYVHTPVLAKVCLQYGYKPKVMAKARAPTI